MHSASLSSGCARRAHARILLMIGLALSATSDGLAQDPMQAPGLTQDAVGIFSPAGPPGGMPARVEAGSSCVIDLTQLYDVSGTLSGTFEIDYRIIVYGPCEVPPVLGKYEEEWIAHGTFSGTMDGTAASATLRYTAHVEIGGRVEGDMNLADGLWGRLEIRGSFGDGQLAYAGRLHEAPPHRQSDEP